MSVKMLWSLMIISFVVLFGWTYCIPLEGECSRNPTQCEEGTIYYQNSTWWSGCHKKCPDGWGCNAGKILCTKSVEDMKQELEKLKDDERMNGFANIQLCMAEKSCTDKQNLDNPSWLDNVLNAFFQPFIEKNGEWHDVIDDCQKLANHWSPSDAIYQCQQLMANYHISHDLKNALNINGCGTQNDWDAIGEYLKSCVGQSDINMLYMDIAINKVIEDRKFVRSQCIEDRELSGLQIEF